MTIETAAREHPAPSDPAARRAGRAWIALLVGAGAALLGLAPWLATGMRLPLQNLWATAEADPERMPLALLPFSQYSIVLIAALLVVGGAFAGVATRWLRARRAVGVAPVLLGLLLAHAAATLQTAVVTEAGLQERTLSTIYLLALVAVAVVAAAAAAGVLALIARAPRAGALVALAITAVLLETWLSAIIVPILRATPQAQLLQSVLLTGLRWLPAVVIGLAIAWAGIDTAGRRVAAAAALLLLWVVPAMITGIANAAGSRVLAHDPAGMLEYGAQVFLLAVAEPTLVLPPLVLAVLVSGLGLVVRAVRARRRAAR